MGSGVASDAAGPRSLVAIYDDIKAHYADNIGHGHNCSCLDKYIRELRIQIDGYATWEKLTAEGRAESKARFAMNYVLNCAVRGM